jgi:hypothetical protein
MRRRRSRRHARRNPFTAVDYWIGIGLIVVGAVAVWAWKTMGTSAQNAALKA